MWKIITRLSLCVLASQILINQKAISCDLRDAECSARRRVVIVGIDGLHAPTLDKMLKTKDDLPNFRKLQASSAWSFEKVHTIQPAVSGPAWTAMIYGKSLNYFAGWINFFRTMYNSAPVPRWFYPKENLFQIIQSSGLQSAAIGNWGSLCGGLAPEEDIDHYDVLKCHAHIEETFMDAGVIDRTLNALNNKDSKGKPISCSLVFSYFGGTDHTCHFSGGPDSENYKDNIREVDKSLGLIMDKINKDDYLCVLTDHGNTDYAVGRIYIPQFLAKWIGSYGWFRCNHALSSFDKDTIRIPFFVKGPGIGCRNIDAELGKTTLSITDVAPLLLELLGLEKAVPEDMKKGALKTRFIKNDKDR